MPLRIAAHLRAQKLLVPASLARDLPHADVRGKAGRQAAPTRELALPHPVYDLRVTDIATGRGLEAAEETGSRHLVVEGDAAVAALEVSGPLASAGAEHLQVQTGPFAEATAAAVRLLEAHEAVQRASFEVRILRVAALHLVAVWLHALEGGEDLILALPPAPPDIRVDVPYSPAELLAVLLPRAQRNSTFTYHR